MTLLVGVDGCSGGWMVVRWSTAGLEAMLSPRWSDIEADEAVCVGVDMPVGLADAGRRPCETAARALLPRGRKSSVFAPPRRYMLGLDWAEANARGRAREGVGLSKQAGNIAPKIAELDAALGPADQDRVREVHPELVFHRLGGWRTLPGKATAAGRDARLALLIGAGMPDPTPLFARFPRRLAKPDDVLDACACALAAWRIALGEARRVPDGEPDRDARGLRMEIWY